MQLSSALDSKLVWGIVGGVIFLATFELLGYRTIPANLYFCRDDGVITMSHARNLAEYHFIGVNPSGEKVEGFSAPLQFFAFFVVYTILQLDPYTYTTIQTAVCSFLLGFLYIQFFHDRKRAGLFITILSAGALTRMYSFLGWQGSGMENAITHVTFLASLYILYDALHKDRINYWSTMVLFMTAISRSEAILYVMPLLGTFSLYRYVTSKRFDGALFSLVVFATWISFEVLKSLYFWDILPNTAYAQSIHVGDRIRQLVALDRRYYNECLDLLFRIFKSHGGGVLLTFAPLLALATLTPARLGLVLFVIVLAATQVFQPLLFGEARLDPTRTTTQLALILVFGASCIVYSLNLNISRTILLTLLMCPLIWIGSQSLPRPYDLGFATGPFVVGVKNQFDKFAREHDIMRPTVANPDLGIMSWGKEMNIVDLGMLGNHFTARLRGGGVSEYLVAFALPDFIESHGMWSEMYASFFSDRRFEKLYAHVIDGGDYQGERGFPQGFWIRRGIMRTSRSRERVFLNVLQGDLRKRDTRLIQHIEEELESASQHDDEGGYIARTVYKYLPELRRQGDYDRVRKLFHQAPRKANLTAYDLYLIEGFRDAKEYSEVMRSLAAKSVDLQEMTANAVYTVSTTEPWGRIAVRNNGTIFAHAPSLYYLDLTKHDIYGRTLSVDFGYTDPKSALNCSDGINFSAYYEQESGSPIVMFEMTVRPGDRFARRQTQTFSVPKDTRIRRVFFKADQLEHSACDWAFWGGFRVEG